MSQPPAAPSAASPPPAPAAPRPVAPAERIEIIDVLRGFALFGILLVNMAIYSASPFAFFGGFELWSAPWDKVAKSFIRMFAEGKFYVLFSFLFGLGFALQLLRGEARGINPVPVYRRRLLVLLLIGAVHAFLIWMGDILMLYALCGFLLILFRRRSLKALLRWAVVLFVLPSVLIAGIVGFLEISRANPKARERIEQSFAEQAQRMEERMAESTRVYSTGSFAEITRQRVYEVGFLYKWNFMFVPFVLGMFLLGFYIGRRGVFRDLHPHLPWVRRMRWPALVVGLAGNAVVVIFYDPSGMSLSSLAQQLGYVIGAPALTFFYVSTLILWWQSERGRRRLRPLAAVGRMALTNYLMQSIVCTLIFYSYGLGFFGQMGPARGIALTLVIYALQIPLSNWWLRHYRFGPAEWLWRSLTYGQAQPMRPASESPRP